MSELTQTNRRNVRWEFLTTVSALALASYVSSTDVAKAEDNDRPTVWIELGGQLESVQGTSRPLDAPFMSVAPVDTSAAPGTDDYSLDIFSANQRVARYALGLEGKLSFQPEDSDWILSAAIRYGRSHSHRHGHEQGPPAYKYVNASANLPLYAAKFADVERPYAESHTVLDFNVGRDVGLGKFGREGASTLNAGVRFAQFSAKSSLSISARPQISNMAQYANFYQYGLTADAQRNFRGIGPSLSWNASAALIGNREDAEVTLDWGLNAAVLFGRQKAQTDHATHGSHLIHVRKQGTVRQHFTYVPLYTPRSYNSDRSYSVAVPNLGAFAGISMRYPNAKVSFGYRADFFFGAMDTGLDLRHEQTVGFNGPFATISVGLGG
jgi:hypothetical protein